MRQWASLSLALRRWWTWRLAKCWLRIWLDLVLWREPVSFLVFSSATVMGMKNVGFDLYRLLYLYLCNGDGREDWHSFDFESDWILLSDVPQWALSHEPVRILVFSTATVMDIKSGTGMVLNLTGSCSLMWANELPCLKRTTQYWLWFWLDLALWREPMSFLVFSSATVMDVNNSTVLALNLIGSGSLAWTNESARGWLTWRMAQCGLWIWLDLAL